MEPRDLSPLQLLLAMRIRHSDELVNRCGLRTSPNNSRHKVVSGQWVKQFISSLHMPRWKHQEHGSLERSIQLLGASTVENKNQHGALRPLCTRSTTLTWTRSCMLTKECPRSRKSRWPRTPINVTQCDCTRNDVHSHPVSIPHSYHLGRLHPSKHLNGQHIPYHEQSAIHRRADSSIWSPNLHHLYRHRDAVVCHQDRSGHQSHHPDLLPLFLLHLLLQTPTSLSPSSPSFSPFFLSFHFSRSSPLALIKALQASSTWQEVELEKVAAWASLCI